MDVQSWSTTAPALVDGSTKALTVSVSEKPGRRLTEIQDVAEIGNRPGLCEAAFQPGAGRRSSHRRPQSLTLKPFIGLQRGVWAPRVTSRVGEACLQFVVGIPPNQEGHEGTDVGVFEPGCHLMQAFIYVDRLQPAGELLAELMSDVLQVRVDAGVTWAGVRR
jgi:hypothetical protein